MRIARRLLAMLIISIMIITMGIIVSANSAVNVSVSLASGSSYSTSNTAFVPGNTVRYEYHIHDIVYGPLPTGSSPSGSIKVAVYDGSTIRVASTYTANGGRNGTYTASSAAQHVTVTNNTNRKVSLKLDWKLA